MGFTKNTTKIFTLIFIVFLTGGWSLWGEKSKPSGSDGKRFIIKQIRKYSQNRIKLVSFQKTNGIQRVLDGVKSYDLEYSAIIEFIEDSVWRIGRKTGFKTVDTTTNHGFFNQGIFVEKGQKKAIEGKILFVLTDNGWRAENIAVNLSDTVVGSNASILARCLTFRKVFRKDGAQAKVKSSFERLGKCVIKNNWIAYVKRRAGKENIVKLPLTKPPFDFNMIDFTKIEPIRDDLGVSFNLNLGDPSKFEFNLVKHPYIGLKFLKSKVANREGNMVVVPINPDISKKNCISEFEKIYSACAK